MTPNDKSIAGIHHVTAITADAQKNVDFYCGVLGLRLVKLTVNFDDPGSYHLYYGDELGRPGTIMTFFAWTGAQKGRIGPPQVSATAFAVPLGALDYWSNRLKEQSVDLQPAVDRFGERVLGFADPDGTRLELIGVSDPKGHPWTTGPIPAEFAIHGFHGVTISEEGHDDTAKLLTDVMGFKAAGREQNRFRYRAGGEGLGSIVDLRCVPDARRGDLGAGVVHHVAFRTPDDPQQTAWQNKIALLGFNVSPIMDRTYFHSIYYREPGGVLFEIATDNPGFTADEPAEQLGSRLALPPWLEKHRAAIERAVPPLRLPVNRAQTKNG
jgi:catechol 2,3-dioxygenase-like lactoylglutathione lyase family enzyme